MEVQLVKMHYVVIKSKRFLQVSLKLCIVIYAFFYFPGVEIPGHPRDVQEFDD